MPHPGAIDEAILERLRVRRGKVHVFPEWKAEETALLVIDMQRTFVEPDAPAEVPMARSIIEPINTMAAFLRKSGGQVFWITHANALSEGGQSDWPLFYDHFVADTVRERTLAYMQPDAPGPQLWPELAPVPEDSYLTKNRYSALIPGSCDLEEHLRAAGITTLLIAGTKTNVCCESTARDGMMLGFKVIMLSDCLAALSDREHWGALETILQQFGDVYSSAEAMSRCQPTES